MEVKVYENREELYQAAYLMYEKQLQEKADSVLGFATGETPIPLYENLVAGCQKGKVDFAKVTTFNLDEYYPMEPTHPQSYRFFMNKNLFSGVNIQPENTFVPAGNAQNPDAIGPEYDRRIEACGGIDLQLLGVGHNGHIGFNEPDEALIAGTHVTPLTDSTLQANARFFASKEEVPTKAVTMGMATILQAKQILCLIVGADKHAVVEQLKGPSITTACPATFLKLHANVTVLCDREAYEGE